MLLLRENALPMSLLSSSTDVPWTDMVERLCETPLRWTSRMQILICSNSTWKLYRCINDRKKHASRKWSSYAKSIIIMHSLCAKHTWYQGIISRHHYLGDRNRYESVRYCSCIGIMGGTQSSQWWKCGKSTAKFIFTEYVFTSVQCRFKMFDWKAEVSTNKPRLHYLYKKMISI